MDRLYFALKLNPCRPTFAQDMTPIEREIMMHHVAYWQGLIDTGVVVVYGPVMDPAGAYGLGVVEVDSESQVREIVANDPASEINTYEWHPMRAIVPPRQ